MSTWIYSLILLELALVAWIDIKIKKISNLWFVANVILGAAFHFIYPLDYPWEWATLIFPIGWIVVGFLLFLVGIMGAGDSKFLASLFVIIPLEHQSIMFEKIIYSTLAVGVVLLAIKIIKDFQKIKAYAFTAYWAGLKESIRSRFSYAPVVFLAWILVGVQLWK